MKKSCILFSAFLICSALSAQPDANISARSAFQDDKFGLFIHWGVFSILGNGEWVMNNEKINVHNYTRLKDFFVPVAFDAAEWVAVAKRSGMKYITLITRHHDGFSLWDTKHSDFNIMNTPYKKDVVKMIADECHKQGIKLFLYYSLLDWRRDDYPYETGRTGQNSGRTAKSDYNSYLQFMKDQITELLTNYGDIAGIWFDGHWDQTSPEGHEDRTSRIDWRYDEIYQLIHRLQPQCMVGNNHHLSPLPGEDFQMFERDLPGENKSGLSFQKASVLPLETCETINGSWGYNIKDTSYKTVKQLIHYLVNAAGRNTNFLLNVGPMPNGKIQSEFADSLKHVGDWLKENGESIYGTRGGRMLPKDWGVTTTKNKTVYVHVLKAPGNKMITIEGVEGKIKSVQLLSDKKPVKYKQSPKVITINLNDVEMDEVDTVLEIKLK